MATAVVATLPIVVERAQYWPFAPAEWYEAHSSFGVTAASTRWGLADGTTLTRTFTVGASSRVNVAVTGP